jgi:integrase
LDLKTHGWVARWRDPLSGKTQQQSLGGLGITSAPARREWAVRKREALDELARAVSVGSVVAERQDAAVAVAAYLAVQGHAATEANKRVPLDAFVAWCRTARVGSLADLKGPHLMRWRDHVLDARRCGHAPSTRNRWLVSTGIFLRWGHRRGLLPLVSLDAVRQSCERAPEPAEAIEFLRPPQLRALLERAVAFDAGRQGDAWRISELVLALLLSGCRFDEIRLLRWGEVADDGIRLAAGRVKTRRARVVTFDVAPALARLLAALRPKDAPADGRVWAIATHSSWDARRRALVASGAPEFTAHGLRRTAGTVLTNAPGIFGGASAWHSAKRLGHSVEQAERDYAGHLPGLPATARTLEDAAGIADLAAAICAAAEARR